MFFVEREPVERPEELQDIQGYQFWVTDDTNKSCTLGVPKRSQDAYFQKLIELARQMADKLKDLRAKALLSTLSLSTVRATIFLAEVTDDLQDLLAVLQGHEAHVMHAAFSPDGQHVVTASQDTFAVLWEVANGRPLAILVGHSGAVKRASFSPDGQRVITASDNATVVCGRPSASDCSLCSQEIMLSSVSTVSMWSLCL